mgnify:FL=1
MEDDIAYKNAFPSIGVHKDSVLKMLTKVATFKMEERDLALDRFKRCNETMEDDAFWLQGKTAIMFLDSASKSSNYLGDMAKDVMKLVFKEEAPPPGGALAGGLSDDDKGRLAELAESHLRERRKGERDKHDRTYGIDKDEE